MPGIIFAGVPDFWQQIVKGGVLILALAHRPVRHPPQGEGTPADRSSPSAIVHDLDLADCRRTLP